jgi:hypothetical protein
MATKKKKTRNKKPTKCRCFYGWVCEVHLNLGNIVAATLQQTFVKILSAIKIPILFLYWGQPRRRKPPVRKTSLNA